MGAGEPSDSDPESSSSRCDLAVLLLGALRLGIGSINEVNKKSKPEENFEPELSNLKLHSTGFRFNDHSN